MSHRSIDQLGRKQKKARLDVAMQRAIEINDMEDNVRHDRVSPPIQPCMDIDEHHHGEQVNVGADPWQEILQHLKVQNNNEDVVLVAEAVDDDELHGNINDEYIFDDGPFYASSDDDEEEDDGMNDGDDPLYFRANISIKESMLLILSLMLRHNLNMTCLADIIQIIQLHCPARDLKRNSLHKFRKFFNIHGDHIQRFFYCPTCTRELQNDKQVCPVCPVKKTSSFIQLPITRHLKEMFKREHFYDQLQQQEARQNRGNSISDIYDGRLYKELHEFLGVANSISFTWYTDGIPVFKSSKVSVWPLCLTINELPYEHRKKKENTLLLGLWYGDQKPHFNLFLYKIRSELQKIFHGIQVNLPNGNRIVVRGILLMGTCDLPAKCDCLHFTQFNGKYGCPVCFTPGESVRSRAHSSVHTYPYARPMEERTLERCLEYAAQATHNAPVYGVRGHTALSLLMPDFLKGMGIDRMHAVDAGVMKKMLNLICNSSYAGEAFSLSDHIETIDSRLKNIKPPKFVHRMPRSIKDLVHWKASEFKMFLFYYAIPVFNGIMEEEYLSNILKLIVAVKILSSDSIDPIQIEAADDLLHSFVREFEDLYGTYHCTINIHLLLHLANCVKNLGPLWLYSCYEYEDLNGQFLKLVHGTGHLETQIATSHSQTIKMIKYINAIPQGPIRDFCLKKKHQVKINEKIDEKIYSVGAYKDLPNLPQLIERALQNSTIRLEHFKISIYFRLLKNEKLYVSSMYTKNLQTSSCIVQYYNGIKKYGKVHCYLKLVNNLCQIDNGCDCRGLHYAVISEIQCDGHFVTCGEKFQCDTAGFLHKVHETDNFSVIPIQFIVTPCFNMCVDGQMFLAVPINSKEHE